MRIRVAFFSRLGVMTVGRPRSVPHSCGSVIKFVDVVPEVSESALRNLKFSELLPRELAVRTLALRGADQAVGSRIARTPVE